MRARLRLVGGGVLALTVVVVFLWVVGPARVARDLAGARWEWAVAAGVLGLATVLAWSESLRQLFAGAGTVVPPRRFRAAFLAGMFGKQLLPVGNASGPALIAFAVNRETDNAYEEDLAVAAVGELSNLVASLAVAAAGVGALLATGSGPTGLLAFGGLVVGGGAVLVAGLLALLFLRRAAFDGLVRRVAAAVGATAGRLSGRVATAVQPERVDAWLDGFGRPLSALASDRRALGAGLAYSLAGWTAVSLALVAAGAALGVSFPVALALFVVPVGGFASAFPLPGGVGGVEVAMAALVVALSGTELVAATAVVLLFRLASFWLPVLVGGLAAASLSVGVGEMARLPAADLEE